MLAQSSSQIIFYAWFSSGGTAKTGLTATINIARGSTGTSVVSAGAMTQVSSTTAPGWYRYILAAASTANADDYIAVASTTDTSVDQVNLPCYWSVGQTWVNRVDATLSTIAASAAASVWGTLTAALTTGSTIGKLLADNVNATISSRQASGSAVTLPTGTGVGQINLSAGNVSLTAVEHTSIAADVQTGLTAQGYTTTRASYLDVLSNLLTNIWAYATNQINPAGATVGARIINNLDATVSSRQAAGATVALAAGEHTAITADVQSGLTAQGYTATRASYLDTLNGIVSAIWSYLASAATVAGSIGKRIADNLDAVVSSRVGTSSYVAPDNASITAIKTQTDKLALMIESDGDDYRFDAEALSQSGRVVSGGGSVAIVGGSGCITLAAEDTDSRLTAFAADVLPLETLIVDLAGNPIDLSDYAVTALLTDAAHAAVDDAASVIVADPVAGRVLVTIQVPDATGRYQLTVQRQNGGAEKVTHGPVMLSVVRR